jgi:tetratricopeptide (TPR) repeat protein
LHQGDFTAAIADFERALAEESIRAEVYLNLSEAWKLAGNVGESRRYEAMSEQLSRLKADPDLSENPE